MPATLVAVLVLTVVVAALALMTMAESAQAFDQLRGLQALGVAEAGAYVALAELRHRLESDLDARVRSGAAPSAFDGPCRDELAQTPGSGAWKIIVAFAYPPALASSDWIDDAAGRQAILPLGSVAAPRPLIDGSGRQIGEYAATVTLRPTTGTDGVRAICETGGPGVSERYLTFFDFKVTATGIVRRAARTICLVGPPAGAVACTGWDALSNWEGSKNGFPVLIERAPVPASATARSAPQRRSQQTFPYTAPRWPQIAQDTLYDRPAWEERTAP